MRENMIKKWMLAVLLSCLPFGHTEFFDQSGSRLIRDVFGLL
jgi:hypothetical protein